MVSTRSGRKTTSVTSVPSRSRAKKDTIYEDTYVEVGQPEVSSPAPAVQSKVFEDRPAPVETFGSPVQPSIGLSTPVQSSMDAVPFLQERVVKTVGKGAPQTPVARTGPTSTVVAPTPSAKEVKQVASVPLPDDASGDETEPYATSEDEPAGPSSSPGKPRTSTPSAAPKERATNGGPGRLFGVFALSSILATFAIALLLAPCADQQLYAKLQSPAYERVCKTLVRGYGEVCSRVEERTWRLRAELVDRVGPLYAKLPPRAQALVGDAWATLQEAHSTAWKAVFNAVELADGHTKDLQKVAKEVYLRASHKAFEVVAPLMEKGLALANKLVSDRSPVAAPEDSAVKAQAPGAAAPAISFELSALSLADFVSVIDERYHQYARELWQWAGQQVAAKQKATAWVLTCDHEAECTRAANGLMMASKSFINVEGASFTLDTSAGYLQSELGTYLQTYPDGLVLVTNVGRMHSNCLAVINAAISESGHLQMNGTPVTTNRALYVFVVEDPLADDAEADNDAQVKERLCQAIAAVEPETPSGPATILSFRRRLDGVLPVAKAS